MKSAFCHLFMISEMMMEISSLLPLADGLEVAQLAIRKEKGEGKPQASRKA